MKQIVITVLVLLSVTTLVAQQPLVMSSPPKQTALFGANFISTAFSERDFALSPDGTELFYTLQAPLASFQTIMHSRKLRDGAWSQPVIAPFAGNYSDLEPAFSFDGKKLYFASNRPVSGTTIKDFDIWVVEKNSSGWGQPQNLGTPVNTEGDEFYPSITQSGNLYYTAAYKSAVGKEDIFVARYENNRFQAPVPLDTAINSRTYEFNAFVAPDESFIIFTSYGRKDDTGRGDLYMSRRDANGKWLPAKNLKPINSDRLDYCPFVSFDRKSFFFTSERNTLQKSFPNKPITIEELTHKLMSPQNGSGDIYWMSFDALLESLQNVN